MLSSYRMLYRPIGQSGINASVIGLGTWAIGGWMWGGTDRADSLRAVQAAIDAGVNLIDTAPAYGLGLSEELVGEAIRGRRDRVVLATKCGLVWHVEQGLFHFEQAGKRVYRFLGAASLRHEVEQSLRRLGTDYIDLYQSHWQEPTTPIEESMGTLMDLKREGKIRAIGVSNAAITDMDRYRSAGVLDSDQEKFSLLDRGPEAERLPYLRRNGISFLAYSPLALGLLTGKITPERQFQGDDLRQGKPRFSVEGRQRVAKMLAEVAPLAAARGWTASQLMLAWTASVPGVTHVLAGARNAEQAAANARAGAETLTPEEMSAIETAAARHCQGL
jgi:methylglyoxal reductase